MSPLLAIVLGGIWGTAGGATLAIAYMVVAKPAAMGIFMAGSGLPGLPVIPLVGALIGAAVGALGGILYWRPVNYVPKDPSGT